MPVFPERRDLILCSDAEEFTHAKRLDARRILRGLMTEAIGLHVEEKPVRVDRSSFRKDRVKADSRRRTSVAVCPLVHASPS